MSKEKFYERGAISTVVREKFVCEIQRITWAYKLAEATINLRGSRAVPEVQVFQINTKTGNVSDQVLTAIDRAIQYPIIFEITRDTAGESQVRMAAAHKLLGPGTLKLSDYYTTGWQAADTERQALPTAITLPLLYIALLEPLMPVVVRLGEDMSEVAARLQTVRKLEREITALERKLRAEPQPNRKLTLRRELKDRRAALAGLL